MDRLTAVRTFSKPGYTPARRVKVFAARWYRATMQNVEHDGLTDYIGLAPGEYTQIVPGTEARQRRNAHLNHLNRLVEYSGPVYRVTQYRYGRASYLPTYVASESEADPMRVALRAEELHEQEATRREIEKATRSLALYRSTEPIPQYPLMSPETRGEWAKSYESTIEGCTVCLRDWIPWRIETEKVR